MKFSHEESDQHRIIFSALSDGAIYFINFIFFIYFLFVSLAFADFFVLLIFSFPLLLLILILQPIYTKKSILDNQSRTLTVKRSFLFIPYKRHYLITPSTPIVYTAREYRYGVLHQVSIIHKNQNIPILTSKDKETASLLLIKITDYYSIQPASKVYIPRYYHLRLICILIFLGATITYLSVDVFKSISSGYIESIFAAKYDSVDISSFNGIAILSIEIFIILFGLYFSIVMVNSHLRIMTKVNDKIKNKTF